MEWNCGNKITTKNKSFGSIFFSHWISRYWQIKTSVFFFSYIDLIFISTIDRFLIESIDPKFPIRSKKNNNQIRANFFLLETYFLSSCLPYYYYFSGFLFCFFGGKRVKQKHSLYSAHTKTFCLICHFRLLIC